MIGESRGRTGQAFTVVSGGQTGVDRAALDAGMDAGVPVGGWCPRGRRAEDGPIPVRYPLRETATDTYAERTRLNVRDSDATLIVGPGDGSPGTSLTAREARSRAKPLLQVEITDRPEAVAAWLRGHDVCVLNVAGPRESEVPGIYRRALAFMQVVLHDVGQG